MTTPPTTHPYASVLRQRAATLREFAATLDRLMVFTIGDGHGVEAWTGHRARLCEQMLGRNLHQLHHAIDDVRSTAFRFQQRADELDAAHRRAA